MSNHCLTRRRVELVRLHASDCEPMHTAAWLGPRPQLHRHHHVRLANDKVRAHPWLMLPFRCCSLQYIRRVQSQTFLVCTGLEPDPAVHIEANLAHLHKSMHAPTCDSTQLRERDLPETSRKTFLSSRVFLW